MEIVLGVLLVAALAAFGFALFKWRESGAAQRRAAEEKAQLDSALAALHEQVRALAKYQAIIDAEATAAQVRGQGQRDAAETVTRARREAEGLLADAKAVHAKTEAARTAAEAASRVTLTQASGEATKIVEAAKAHAERIAGDALAAVRDVKRLEKTAKAMKNVIEGYGDRYVVPTFGLLDDLAAEFGFAEAGQRLKAARERMREMIKQGTAASCDYVEQNRKTTAIEFVLDAFNGKVDTALASVRHDNYGTLKEKINDAFMIVNNNGRAFRDARIEPAYLGTRQDELRWAVVAQELKAKDREEQRLIKERIREEERAQRDYDRAMKEAEKEEETIRKAMEKARREFEKAGGDQKAKFEEQLRELTAKLQIAEEKNQRALSMAQQTKTGNVYVISNVGSFGEHVYKIGMTRRLEPLDRVRELGDASVPFSFDVHAMIPSQDAPALEHALHKRFVRSQMNKVNPRKEFFRLSLQEVREEIEKMGCHVQWTTTAECREFRETQAIEREMASKTFDEQAWLKDQAIKEREIAQREVDEAEMAI